MPTWIVSFDEEGACELASTQEALLAKTAEQGGPSHIIFMSHGWNSDFGEAIRQYKAFLAALSR